MKLILLVILLALCPALAHAQFNNASIVQGTTAAAITDTTSTQVLASPGVGFRNNVTTIVCSNSHATVGTDINIQDGPSGPTLMTIPAPALYGAGANVSLGVFPLKQSQNKALHVAPVTTGASVKCSAVGYKAP